MKGVQRKKLAFWLKYYAVAIAVFAIGIALPPSVHPARSVLLYVSSSLLLAPLLIAYVVASIDASRSLRELEAGTSSPTTQAESQVPSQSDTDGFRLSDKDKAAFDLIEANSDQTYQG